jgi:ABC-type multidrug transport system ATPase subunit
MDLRLDTANSFVILGANGSGKSTLLQIIAGNLVPSEGTISYRNGTGIPGDAFYAHISMAAPYLELIEEFTLNEMLRFHAKFKTMKNGMGPDAIIERCYLGDAANKKIKDYSSGMKQRVKLALAILSDTPVLLLDEPCSNLDAKGVDWYKKLIEEFNKDRLIIVCSNEQKDEYGFCKKEIRVENYKK